MPSSDSISSLSLSPAGDIIFSSPLWDTTGLFTSSSFLSWLPTSDFRAMPNILKGSRRNGSAGDVKKSALALVTTGPAGVVFFSDGAEALVNEVLVSVFGMVGSVVSTSVSESSVSYSESAMEVKNQWYTLFFSPFCQEGDQFSEILVCFFGG